MQFVLCCLLVGTALGERNMIEIDKNLTFDQYSQHYKEVVLLDQKGKEQTIKVSGWLKDLIQNVKEQGKQEYKRELRNFLGIIS